MSLQFTRRGSVWGTNSQLLVPTNILNYGCLHPQFSTHLWLSLIHWTPVLGGRGIFLALCSSAAQCLLWSGAKDFFPWLLVLQKALCPWRGGWGWGEGGQGQWGDPQIGGKRTWNEWRELKGAGKSPVKTSTRTKVWESDGYVSSLYL